MFSCNILDLKERTLGGEGCIALPKFKRAVRLLFRMHVCEMKTIVLTPDVHVVEYVKFKVFLTSLMSSIQQLLSPLTNSFHTRMR